MESRPEPEDEAGIDAPSEPMMEAPGASTDASVQASESWNPGQGDRSFGYGTTPAGHDASDPTDDTTDAETEDADGEAGR